jgi:RNA-directed DNA polymerase
VRVDDWEKELQRRGPRVARSWEDVLLGVPSRRAGARVKPRLPRFLRPPRKRERNETKRTGGPPTEGPFLGFTFHGPRMYGAPEALQECRPRGRQLTGRSWGVSMA